MEEFKLAMALVQTGSSVVILVAILFHLWKRTAQKEDKQDDSTAAREKKLFDYIDKLIANFGENTIKYEAMNTNILERLDYQGRLITSLIEKIDSNQYCPLMKKKEKEKEKGESA